MTGKKALAGLLAVLVPGSVCAIADSPGIMTRRITSRGQHIKAGQLPATSTTQP